MIVRCRLVVLAFAVGLAACAPADARPLGPGDRIPEVSGVRLEQGSNLVWVLRPEDYLTCTTAARGVRRIQSRQREPLTVTVLYVGEHPEWARGFLKRQRIEGGLVVLAPREYRRAFGGPPGPWLYWVRDGRVVRAARAADSVQVMRLTPGAR